MEQIELSKNLARVQELAKALRITPLFERLVDLKKEGLLVNPKFSFEELVIDLLENVKASRENKKVNTLLKTMDIHHPTACINSIRWDVGRTGITSREVTEYNTCDWIRAKQSMIFIGPTGAGKTYLADCLAVSAITAGFKVFYRRAPYFLAEIKDITSAAQMRDFYKSMQSYDLIYLDDFGIGALTEQNQAILAELADKCFGKVSFLLTSQNDVKSWLNNYFIDADIGEAFCDRIYKPAIKFHINGPSLREAQVKITTQTTSTNEVPSEVPAVPSQSPITSSKGTTCTTKRKRGRPRKTELTTENIETLSGAGTSGTGGIDGTVPPGGTDGIVPKVPHEEA